MMKPGSMPQLNGHHEYTYYNGDIYIGDFLNGKRHGLGKLTIQDPQGRGEWIYKGRWVDDDLPHGTQISFSGQTYVGDLVGLRPHGKGK